MGESNNECKEKERQEATLMDFIGLIKEETDLVNDPLFSKSAIDQYQEKKSYAVKCKKDEKNGKQRKEIYLVCGKGQLVDQCKEFMAKSPKKKT